MNLWSIDAIGKLGVGKCRIVGTGDRGKLQVGLVAAIGKNLRMHINIAELCICMKSSVALCELFSEIFRRYVFA